MTNSTVPTDRFAFAYYVDTWKPDLRHQLHISAHSLATRTGRAATYPRYLVFSDRITDEVRAFAAHHGLILRPEPLLTNYRSLPNKALLCKAPAHEVVCTVDLDIVFLRDPTPAFEQAAEEERVLSRYELLLPLWGFPNLSQRARDWWRFEVGQKIWLGQYRRFAPHVPPPTPGPPAPGLEGRPALPAYFNTGVNFIPGRYLPGIGDSWWYCCSRMMRDRRLGRPYQKFFAAHFIEQMCYALALHREQAPWSVLHSRYNYVPMDVTLNAARDDLDKVSPDEVVMVHLASPVRDWMSPQGPAAPHPAFLPILKQVREVVTEALASPSCEVETPA